MDAVVQIFDYCQILEASVFAKGWRFLFRTHGMDGLLRINERSEWFEAESVAELKERFIEVARDCGYDPVEDEFGKVDEGTGRFIPAPS